MSLSSLHLDAFSSLAQCASFSAAARAIHITQSALSQRIKHLEESLETTLVIRDPAGIKLTATGEKLLRYIHAKNSMEESFLKNLLSEKADELAGPIRLGAYSSIMRSVVMPALAPLIRKHPKIECEFLDYEIRDLPDVLRKSAADLIIMDYKLERENIVSTPLGNEVYVAIESARYSGREHVYLDHDPEDQATNKFFAEQKNPPKFRREYMGDVYGILDAVSLGMGRAVMSKHLISPKQNVKILPQYRALNLPVVLHYYAQPYYSKLFLRVVEELRTRCAVLL